MLRSQQRRENRRRLHGLDRIDPATGLINAPMFLERLLLSAARDIDTPCSPPCRPGAPSAEFDRKRSLDQ